MTGFARSPALKKGALIVLEEQQNVRQLLLFQYNPESLTRSLRASYQSRDGSTGSAGAGEPAGLKGPPAETIRLDVEIDAADQLELGVPSAVSLGVYPALAALEALLLPSAEKVISDEALRELGGVEIIPPRMPLILFVWGAARVLPVRISDLSITEQAFDPDLNPILAKASLTLEVLTYQDFGSVRSVGGGLYLAHHIATEVLARAHSTAGAATAAAQALTAGITGSRG